ncbi:hypothetical protein LTR10_014853 [Elasticomyces elasticus]|uniref:Uncharacterized protein n=1 Tax=Exophiala sideris TaxID=1016849 RepID=A0ABR0JG38_9EURO|nr:hypothetical protein LTR10_014853 [Elasticomyces elasticus]KAK5025696.1 hypothetical protein LTS07_007900 [Exophiala sideris]KAK5033095.1 hypothetical protein LTR13_007060 [Exophiala sideris]KAK5063580.1 hypothetical protein LTR69_004286 [Exophiala sideris]KAK5180587.1 hypothetical protein LTR44_006901 [Eurotiomycetes sp. CCFEE 6388]
MPDDEWYYGRRRIPITRGWGPCKRTQWVPTNEYYTGRNPRRVRTFFRAVGIDPDAQFERHRIPIIYLDDDDHVPIHYAGFRERGPGDANWRYYPEGGGNSVPPRQPPIPRDTLDPVVAEALQHLEETGAQQHRDNINQINAQINVIDGRYRDHINTYEENMRGGIVDSGGRLGDLRNEISLHERLERFRDMLGKSSTTLFEGMNKTEGREGDTTTITTIITIGGVVGDD